MRQIIIEPTRHDQILLETVSRKAVSIHYKNSVLLPRSNLLSGSRDE